MPLLDRPVGTIDDRVIGILNKAVSAADSSHDTYVLSDLVAAARLAHESGDAVAAIALSFLARLLRLPIEGLDPLQSAGAAAATPKAEPTPAELDAMRAMALGLCSAGVRARIADLVWQFQRDHAMARLAVQAYLEAGAPFENPSGWTGCTHRYSRALGLAAALGKASELYRETLASLEGAVRRHGGTDDSYLSRELMDIIYDHKKRDRSACAEYSALAEQIARRVEGSGNYFRARDYWSSKESWDRARGDLVAARYAVTAAAETLVKEADAELARTAPDYGRAVLFLRQAIGVLDKVQPDSRTRISDLRIRLSELSEKAAASIVPMRVSVDIHDLVQVARQRVSGKALPEAILALAFIVRPPSRATLEANVRVAMKSFLHYSLVPKVIVGPGGSLVGARAAVDSSDPDLDPVISEMVSDAQLYFSVAVDGSVEIGRSVIDEEHDVRRHHFSQLAFSTPFVPPGREGLFVEGLFAGMKGDFLTAVHLLVPQVENAIRCQVKAHGENTVFINHKGFDEEKDLDSLLRLPMTTEIFGADVCFALRALLLHRAGPNLRNLLAHGLLDPQSAVRPAAFIWWLVLHLSYLPLVAERPGQSAQAPAAPGAGAEVQ